MKWMLFAAGAVFAGFAFSEETAAPAPLPDETMSLEMSERPAEITSSDLKDFDDLPDARQHLIEAALAVLKDNPWMPYIMAGAEPETGGFDCSGAVYFVLNKVGIEPPRSSAGQYEWLKSNGRLRLVPADVTEKSDPAFAKLKPGDLIFWSVAAATPEEPDAFRVHHVAIYLGLEKKDGRPVIINATDGRSYRGQRANGYGVYDFVVPKAESKSKIAGYGTPPGLPE